MNNICNMNCFDCEYSECIKETLTESELIESEARDKRIRLQSLTDGDFDKRKISQARYEQSDKGKARRVRYEQSDKGKAKQLERRKLHKADKAAYDREYYKNVLKPRRRAKLAALEAEKKAIKAIYDHKRWEKKKREVITVGS